MARPTSKHPTEFELEILKILWREGPCTGRQVLEKLNETRDLAYTSVITIMNIMRDKRYLTRKKQGGSFLYSPKISEQSTTRSMLGDLVTRLFDGSTEAAMVRLLETSDLDSDEIKALRKLLDRKAKGGQS
jgi:BlaI family penicillinase repressor